jgi:hypothetical protein
MIAPVAVRDVAAAAGALLVLSTVVSVIGTVIVPRKSGSRLTRLVASVVDRIFGLIVWPVASYRWRDRILAGQAAVILLGQLVVWLGAFYLGYALLIWPATGSIGAAFTSVGPALWTFGSPDTHGFFETAVLDTAADITESHVTYRPLVWFRSPSHEASWVTSLLAVLDSAALYLSLCPQAAPAVPARLCLRSGLVCFSEVAHGPAYRFPSTVLKQRVPGTVAVKRRGWA